MHANRVPIRSDGFELQATLHQAKGDGPFPTLLLVHGWPGSPGDVLGMGERLVEHGLNVLALTPRGLHESEGTASFAGTDHGALIAKVEGDDAYGAAIRDMLRTTQSPRGPVRFDVDASLDELRRGTEIYGLQENAARLADRAILLFGAWEDESTTVDDYMLPLYRSLKGAGAEDVTFIVYHDDHAFGQVRDRMAVEVADWIGHRARE